MNSNCNLKYVMYKLLLNFIEVRILNDSSVLDDKQFIKQSARCHRFKKYIKNFSNSC